MPGAQIQRCHWACWGKEQRLGEAKVQRMRARGASAAVEMDAEKILPAGLMRKPGTGHSLSGVIAASESNQKTHGAEGRGVTWSRSKFGKNSGPESIKTLQQTPTIFQSRSRNSERRREVNVFSCRSEEPQSSSVQASGNLSQQQLAL